MRHQAPSYFEKLVAAIRGQGLDVGDDRKSTSGAFGGRYKRGEAGDKLRKRFAKAGRAPRGY